MAKVTKETMKALSAAGVFPPRHQQGCPKNFARCLPMLYAARGLTTAEIRRRVRDKYDKLPCTCKEEDVLKEW